MTQAHPLFRSAVYELVCAGGLGGGSVEVSDGTGAALASADRAGAVVGLEGTPLLQAPLRFDGRRDQGTNAMLDVSAPDGTALGEVRVRKYTVTPRSSRATLSLEAAGAEVGRLEPADGKGEELAITVGDRRVGTLYRQSKKGFLRTSTTYRLELTGDIHAGTRPLLVAAAIRYHALVSEATGAGRTA